MPPRPRKKKAAPAVGRGDDAKDYTPGVGRFSSKAIYWVPVDTLEDVPAETRDPGRTRDIVKGIKEKKVLPPIKVTSFTHPDTKEFGRELVDGNHRLSAAREFELTHIRTRFSDRKAWASPYGKRVPTKPAPTPRKGRKKADPNAPTEAVDWFRARVPMKKKDWLALDERAQRKAFTIARVANLRIVADVMEDLAKSLEKGEGFETFKKKVSEKLTKAWGEERPWHIETIFRNASQRAYTAGRKAQMTDPAVLKLRPYWCLEPLLDARTTVICQALRPRVVLPAEHPFFRTRVPPLHHNCRTVLYSLNSRRAKQMGVTRPKRLTSEKPAEGFGGADPLEWQPDLSSIPKALVKVYSRGK